jgi:hypothetical protein
MPNCNVMEHVFNAISNISRGWQQIKGCHSKDNQQAKNMIIPMLPSESTSSIHYTSLVIGIHCCTLHLTLPEKCHWNCKLTMCCGHFVGSKKGKMH